jgi:hypothetical protein
MRTQLNEILQRLNCSIVRGTSATSKWSVIQPMAVSWRGESSVTNEGAYEKCIQFRCVSSLIINEIALSQKAFVMRVALRDERNRSAIRKWNYWPEIASASWEAKALSGIKKKAVKFSWVSDENVRNDIARKKRILMLLRLHSVIVPTTIMCKSMWVKEINWEENAGFDQH